MAPPLTRGWTTLECLVLAQAVHHHGAHAWPQVARALQQHPLILAHRAQAVSQTAPSHGLPIADHVPQTRASAAQAAATAAAAAEQFTPKICSTKFEELIATMGSSGGRTTPTGETAATPAPYTATVMAASQLARQMWTQRTAELQHLIDAETAHVAELAAATKRMVLKRKRSASEDHDLLRPHGNKHPREGISDDDNDGDDEDDGEHPLADEDDGESRIRHRVGPSLSDIEGYAGPTPSAKPLAGAGGQPNTSQLPSAGAAHSEVEDEEANRFLASAVSASGRRDHAHLPPSGRSRRSSTVAALSERDTAAGVSHPVRRSRRATDDEAPLGLPSTAPAGLAAASTTAPSTPSHRRRRTRTASHRDTAGLPIEAPFPGEVAAVRGDVLVEVEESPAADLSVPLTVTMAASGSPRLRNRDARAGSEATHDAGRPPSGTLSASSATTATTTAGASDLPVPPEKAEKHERVEKVEKHEKSDRRPVQRRQSDLSVITKPLHHALRRDGLPPLPPSDSNVSLTVSSLDPGEVGTPLTDGLDNDSNVDSHSEAGSRSETIRSVATDRHRSWRRLCLMIWMKISDHRYGHVFMNPVKPERMPDYTAIVKRPMCLNQVKARIREREITTTAEFQRDVLLVFTNAIMYYAEGSQLYNMAMEMLLSAESEMQHLTLHEVWGGQTD
ncbi:hypothetical protein CXG81DRAFT_18310 [Caulochytrium protostelioides]|uniref:Bromo domain-containing protein n=2 Tax=Caulochytrium protostelioides TaxID=1555241 RepID=A0A4P9XA74_9FUNG|nr:hypothetical protein CXG81DRAFT_18310 [Caulochytrium protostelioides]|eukprot:RKP01951.1 hypothetical protein CXG81DRAFT_18310 [Caulochytrium protostelioides]